jgi:hypothetical protein
VSKVKKKRRLLREFIYMASFIGVKKEKRLKTVEPFSNYQE